MKKKVMTVALLCAIEMSCKAQVYAYDSYARLPSVDLYDTNVMNMSLRSAAPMAEMRRQYYMYYGERAVDDYNNDRWTDAISDATTL